MPNKGTKNKKKAKHKNPPSKKRDTTSQESKPRTDELVDMITEASKKDLNDNKQQKFMSLAKDLHYDEILAGLSHAYLYPSNVLISDVDNKEYNNSVLEIDFSSEKGRVFKKTLAYINTNNKNYQEFVRKVQKIQRRDIKISLLDIFDIIYCKIQDTIKNISIITEEDISSILSFIQFHDKDSYNLDEFFSYSYFFALYQIISLMHQLESPEDNILCLTEFLNILAYSLEKNDTVKDIDSHVLLQVYALFLFKSSIYQDSFEKHDSSTIERITSLSKKNIFYHFDQKYKEASNQGLLEEVESMTKLLNNLSIRHYQTSKKYLIEQNENIGVLPRHNLIHIYNSVQKGIISSLLNPKLSNKIKTVIFKNILFLSLDHAEIIPSLETQTNTILQDLNKYINDLKKLIVDVSSFDSSLQINKKKKKTTNDKINLLIQELLELHKCLSQYVEQYTSLTSLYSEFSSDLKGLEYNVESLDKNFIEKYTNALHQQYKDLNVIIKSIKDKKLSIEELSTSLCYKLDHKKHTDQVEKIRELSNILSYKDMQNSLDIFDIKASFIKNIIDLNSFIVNSLIINIYYEIKQDLNDLKHFINEATKIQPRRDENELLQQEVNQNSILESIKKTQTVIEATFKYLKEQLHLNINAGQVKTIEGLVKSILSKDLENKLPVIDQLINLLTSFVNEDINDIKFDGLQELSQELQVNVNSFGKFDGEETQYMLKLYNEYSQKSEDVKKEDNSKKKPKGTANKQTVFEVKEEQQDKDDSPTPEVVTEEVKPTTTGVITPETVEEVSLLEGSEFQIVGKKGKEPKPKTAGQDHSNKSKAIKSKTAGKDKVSTNSVKISKSVEEGKRKDSKVKVDAKPVKTDAPKAKSVVEVDRIFTGKDFPKLSSSTTNPQQGQEINTKTIGKDKASIDKVKIFKSEEEDQQVKTDVITPETIAKDQPVAEPTNTPAVEKKPVKSKATKHKFIIEIPSATTDVANSKSIKEVNRIFTGKDFPKLSSSTTNPQQGQEINTKTIGKDKASIDKVKIFKSEEEDQQVKTDVTTPETITKDQPVAEPTNTPAVEKQPVKTEVTTPETIAKDQPVAEPTNTPAVEKQPVKTDVVNSKSVAEVKPATTEVPKSEFVIEIPSSTTGVTNLKSILKKTSATTEAITPETIAKDQPVAEPTNTPAVEKKPVKTDVVNSKSVAEVKPATTGVTNLKSILKKPPATTEAIKPETVEEAKQDNVTAPEAVAINNNFNRRYEHRNIPKILKRKKSLSNNQDSESLAKQTALNTETTSNMPASPFSSPAFNPNASAFNPNAPTFIPAHLATNTQTPVNTQARMKAPAFGSNAFPNNAPNPYHPAFDSNAGMIPNPYHPPFGSNAGMIPNPYPYPPAFAPIPPNNIPAPITAPAFGSMPPSNMTASTNLNSTNDPNKQTIYIRSNNQNNNDGFKITIEQVKFRS